MHHVPRDTALADVDAEFQQLAVNAADQVASLAGNRGESRLSPSNLPSPKQAKAHAMPSHNRFRRDREAQKRRSIAVIFRRFFQRALKHADLVAQGQILELHVSTRKDRRQDSKECRKKNKHQRELCKDKPHLLRHFEIFGSHNTLGSENLQ